MHEDIAKGCHTMSSLHGNTYIRLLPNGRLKVSLKSRQEIRISYSYIRIFEWVCEQPKAVRKPKIRMS